MTIEEFINMLDGNGLEITDWAKLHEVLVNDIGVFEYDAIEFSEDIDEEDGDFE